MLHSSINSAKSWSGNIFFIMLTPFISKFQDFYKLIDYTQYYDRRILI